MKLELKRILLLITVVSSAFAQVSSEKEVLLGTRMEAEIEIHQKMSSDAEVLSFVNRVLKTLLNQESLRVPLELKVVDNPGIFVASALPGGILLLSSGAILRSENEAELAGVLSHAMGHAQTGQVDHPSRSVGSTIPLIFLGGPWGLCERSPGGIGRSMMHQTEEAGLIESQADLLGLGYMINGNYDPHAMLSVVEHWGGGGFRPDEELRAKADLLTKVATMTTLNSSAFDQMKARLASSSPALARRPPTLYK